MCKEPRAIGASHLAVIFVCKRGGINYKIVQVEVKFEIWGGALRCTTNFFALRSARSLI